MRVRSGLMVIVTTTLLAGLTAFHSSAADGPYRKIKEIPIPGEGGWDYLNIDTASQRLYVSHASKVVGASATEFAS